MRTRRSARQLALQAIYQCDTLDDWSDNIIETFFEHFTKLLPESDGAESGFEGVPTVPPVERSVIDDDYARRLIFGVRLHLKLLDETLNEASIHWTVARMARVDRSILRLATYEMLFLEEVPVAAIINEAIEIAKRFSGGESPHFINGVLDSVARVRKRTGNAEG